VKTKPKRKGRERRMGEHLVKMKLHGPRRTLVFLGERIVRQEGRADIFEVKSSEGGVAPIIVCLRIGNGSGICSLQVQKSGKLGNVKVSATPSGIWRLQIFINGEIVRDIVFQVISTCKRGRSDMKFQANREDAMTVYFGSFKTAFENAMEKGDSINNVQIHFDAAATETRKLLPDRNAPGVRDMPSPEFVLASEYRKNSRFCIPFVVPTLEKDQGDDQIASLTEEGEDREMECLAAGLLTPTPDVEEDNAEHVPEQVEESMQCMLHNDFAQQTMPAITSIMASAPSQSMMFENMIDMPNDPVQVSSTDAEIENNFPQHIEDTQISMTDAEMDNLFVTLFEPVHIGDSFDSHEPSSKRQKILH